MDKLKESKVLIEAVRRVTLAHGKYLSSKRAYLDGDELYMREAHFVMSVGMVESQTMSELAERLGVTAGAVSQLALRMEQKGYVRRETPKEDKRVNIITLTDKGEALCREHEAFDNEQYARFASILDGYTCEQLEMIKKFEQKLANIFIQ